MAEDTEKNTAVHKALDILLLFRGKQQRLSVDEISELLGIPKSTVYRHVRTLCDRGLLEKNSAANYRLGLTLLELSRAALASNRDLRLIALPSMRCLADEVGESVSLMRLFNRQAICLDSIEGQHALRVTIEQGRAQPLHAGASSKVLLAYVRESEWEDHLTFPLERFTQTTTTDLRDLKAQLHAIRQEGYCISDGEIDVGARAIAVPLMNERKEVVAALSIEGPASRMGEATLMRYLDILRREAEIIHRELS